MIYNAKINSSGHIKSFGHGDTYSWVIWVIIGLGNNLWPCSTKPLPVSVLKIKPILTFKSKGLLGTNSVKFSSKRWQFLSTKCVFVLSAILFRPQRVTRLLHSSSVVAIDCQWGMRHGLQVAGITLLWLVGLNIDWDYLLPHCIMGSCDQWEFPLFFRHQWQSPCTAPTAGKCLPLGLCKGTVNQSSVTWTNNDPFQWHIYALPGLHKLTH